MVGYYDHEDIPGTNKWGPVSHDEEIFASELVTCVGQQIGIVVAETEAAARDGAKAVRIEYEDLPGAVFSCEEAIAAGSYIEVSLNPQYVRLRMHIKAVAFLGLTPGFDFHMPLYRGGATELTAAMWTRLLPVAIAITS